MTTQVADNTAESRYEITVDGKVAGYVAYRRSGDRVALIHTEVFGGYEGQGIGGKLASGALDDIRAAGLSVAPVCPFITRFIRKRGDEYLPLVPEEYRAWVRGDDERPPRG
ncbi:GNAT family N-acetyltransferase [Allonocardiopsis opalescens]|uniref:GNAT family N-acetyltransferase n=1 Tax=Allonocardiopsis opalescens TaxID=1144618 RepID=UPI000D081D8D|nr:GNAT family N-acetyltransferase [Allonocardiopsis opalescens]